MSCLQHCRGTRIKLETGRRAQRPASRVAQLQKAELPSVISGTWDFKWPIGAELRVAFQRLPPDVEGINYQQARKLVVDKLEAWLEVRFNDAIAKPNLTYVIAGDLPAPREATGNRRPVKSDADGGQVVEYDVLVSFLPLPVYLPANEQHPTETLVGTSASDLGRYALRSEYGVPTVFLGPLAHAKPETWFSSAEGIFTVVHELGHVLGLPHEEQNPLADDLPWKSIDEIVAIVKARGALADEVDVKAFIEEEITTKWPGEQRFSDWRQPAAVEPGYDFKSVMAKPSYRCLLRGVHGASCKPEGCPTYESDLARLGNPTDGDLRHLNVVYGERPDLPALQLAAE